MSVMLIKDDFKKDLDDKVTTMNLTLAAGQSKTTVSFTNNFTLIPPVIQNTTEINIYRPLTQCTGTPCDPNKKFTSNQNLILCECLKPDNTNSFFKKLQETGTVISNTTQTLGDTINNGTYLIFVAPNKTLSDFKFWTNSVVILFASFTAAAIVAIICELSGGIISRLACSFFNKVSARFMVSQQNQALKDKSNSKDKKEDKDKKEKKDDKDDKDSVSSDSSDNDSIKGLKKAFKDDKDILKCLESPSASKPLTGLKLFGIVFLTNHFLLAIFFSKGTHYSRKAMISTVYTRMAYSLAITMLFSMGYDKDGYTNYQTFVLKCLAVPILISPILFVTKKLMKDENQYDLFSKCKGKPKVAPATPEMDKMPRRSSKDITGNRGSNNIYPRSQGRTRSFTRDRADSPSRSSQEFLDDMNSPNITSGHSPCITCRIGAFSKIDKITTPFKKSVVGVVRITTAYVINAALIPVSALVVVSVANNTSKNDSWPVGYWYMLQLSYDLSLGQVPAALVQFGFLKSQLASPANKLAAFTNKYLASWLMNSDVKAITDLNSSIHHN